MANENYDAIVVGSGISGGWAAKELTEKGLTVLLLERGKNIEHVKDYVNAHKGPWEYPHRGNRTYAMEEAYPVLRRDYPLNERNLDWWVNEKESPYTEVKRFDWYRGYHVGGRSLLWGRQSYRWSDFDFEANARDGIAIDWPIRYAELAPWYDYVERHAGIAGSIEGLAQLPDGQFQPAMPLNCGEELVAGRMRGLFDGRRRIIPGRVANLTQPLPGRAPCQYRNACWLGCPYGAYFSTQSSTLPAAMATGRLTLKPFSIATEVLYDKRPAARDGRARARRGHGADDGVHGARRVRLRVDVEQHVAADAFGDGRLARGLGLELGRARPQPDGPSLPRRRRRLPRRRAAERPVLLRQSADGLLHSALPQSARREARVSARLRLSGQREPARLAARRARAGIGGDVQGSRRGAGRVADRRARRSARSCRATTTR